MENSKIQKKEAAYKMAAISEAVKNNAANIVENNGYTSVPSKKTHSIVLAYIAAQQKPKKAPYKKPEAVKQLETMADAEQQRQHPNFPPKYLAKSKYRDDTANGLTRCIVDYIRLQGGQAERINTTGIPKDTRQQVTDILGRTRTIGSVTWRTGGGTPGSADISATIRGRSVKIETKIGKDRQSEAQRQYQDAIEAAGGLYYIAKTFTEFVNWYTQQFGKEVANA